MLSIFHIMRIYLLLWLKLLCTKTRSHFLAILLMYFGPSLLNYFNMASFITHRIYVVCLNCGNRMSFCYYMMQAFPDTLQPLASDSLFSSFPVLPQYNFLLDTPSEAHLWDYHAICDTLSVILKKRPAFSLVKRIEWSRRQFLHSLPGLCAGNNRYKSIQQDII